MLEGARTEGASGGAVGRHGGRCRGVPRRVRLHGQAVVHAAAGRGQSLDRSGYTGARADLIGA